jgi:hypothetical protein
VAADRVQALRRALGWPAPQAPAPGVRHLDEQATDANRQRMARVESRSFMPTRSREPEAPALPPLPQEPDLWMPTSCGGALFWLAQLTRQGFLQAGDGPAAPLAVRLWALVRALGVPDEDPASTAFCGGAHPQTVPAPADADEARAWAQRFEDWLGHAAPELPVPRLAAVCQRRGRLRIEPGWITLALPLHSVDTPVRRLGLDLTPGWLPWLGAALVIRYED